MQTSLQMPRRSHVPAVGLLLLCAAASDSPGAQSGTETGAPASSAAATAPQAEPKGNFFSSLKQAFRQDFEHEVVRGHFEVGSPPDVHRYYCLVDPKTGKTENNGVAGQLVQRTDGMTGIKGAAVSFYSCSDAEQKGILTTTGYVLNSNVSSRMAAAHAAPNPPPAVAAPPAQAPSPPVAPPRVELSGPSAAPSTAPTPPAAAALAPRTSAPPAAADMTATEPAAAPADGARQSEITAIYSRFIAGQNAHDRAAVAAVLLDSKDFVCADYGGETVWGYGEALDAFAAHWKGTWRLDPQPNQAHIVNVSPGVALLLTPLLLTQGSPGDSPATVPATWGGVFVKTRSGWRIASIFVMPFKAWRAPT